MQIAHATGCERGALALHPRCIHAEGEGLAKASSLALGALDHLIKGRQYS